MENEKVKTIGRKLSKFAIYSISYVLLLSISYLIVGFVTGDWHPGWLIIVIGLLGGSCIALGFLCKKFMLAGKSVFARLTALPIVAMFQICVYLILSLCSKRNVWAESWLILVLIPLDMFLTDIATCYLMSHKISKSDIGGAVFFAALDLYLILAVLDIVAWHPYWCIILGGVIIDLILAIVYLVGFRKKKI